MELTRNISAEKVQFRDAGMLSDIAHEASEVEGFGQLTEDQIIEKVENILLEKIKNGEKQAYFQLGLFYFEQEIYDKAKKYFERAKDFDYQSLYMLSVILYDGLGCEAETATAVEYLIKIANSNSRQCRHLLHAAQFNIGRAYFQGYGCKRQSDAECERWWLLAADDGNPKASVKAQTALALFYSREENTDLKKAFFWHSEACGNGSLESQGALGVMYEHGVGTKQDTDAAYTCLKQASDRGNVYAMGNLVAHYYRRKLHTKAADLAFKVSQLKDVEEIAEKTECLLDYIKKGISMACFYYGRCLQDGLGTDKDKEKSKHYFSRSFAFDPDVCARLQNITQHGAI